MQRWVRGARRDRSPRATFLVVLVGFLSVSTIAWAESTPKRFLEALKQRGYDDMALYYLDRLSASTDCPAELKETLDIEVGKAHRSAADRAQSIEERRGHFSAAHEAFTRFLQQHPEHALTGETHLNAGLAAVEQAKLIQSQTTVPGRSDAEKTQMTLAARARLEDARASFQAAETFYLDKARALVENSSAGTSDALDEARAFVLQSRLLLASIEEEIGLTWPKGSAEYTAALTQAAAAYRDLFVRYNTLNAGLYAKLYEARVRLALGEPQLAKTLVQELTVVETRPDTLTLKIESLALLVEIAMDPKTRDFADALRRVEAWQAEVPGSVEQTVSGLKVHLLAGKARLSYARQMTSKDTEYARQITGARRHFEFVTKFNSPYRREATTLLLEPEFAATISARSTTFEEAVLQGETAIRSLQTLETQLREAKGAAERETVQREIESTRNGAIDAFRLALELAGPRQTEEAINRVRYMLAQLYFLRNDLFHAAVLGETVARRHPRSNGAKMAVLAAKAYRKMMLDARQASEDSSFGAERLDQIADYVMTRWQGSLEADEVCILLIDAAIERRDLPRASALLEKIAPDSPRRGPTELLLGQTLWSEYLSASKQDEAQRPSQESLGRMVSLAEDTLAQGLQRTKQQLGGLPPDRNTVIGVLSLAQIKIDRGDPATAVQWLKDPVVGPLTLIDAGLPVIADNAFKISVYMTSLRAYVGAQQLDDAERTMDALEKLVGEGDGDSAKRLTEIYIVLGGQLEQLLRRLGDEGKDDEMQRVSKGFESFLERISARDAGNTFSSLNWVAETYFSLGSGLHRGAGDAPPEAVNYYRQAARTYNAMRKRAEAEPEWAPAGAIDNITVRLASCVRAMGDPKLAMDLLLGVIRATPRRVDVQIEAAKTYQQWGRKEPGYYEKAIVGGQVEGGEPLVWGWATIARRVAPLEQHRNLYFDATYNKNLCRVLLAQTLTGAQRDDQLQRAELDIVRHYRMYPAMGGPEWFEKYDALLVRIRRFRGQSNPVGLRAEGN